MAEDKKQTQNDNGAVATAQAQEKAVKADSEAKKDENAPAPEWLKDAQNPENAQNAENAQPQVNTEPASGKVDDANKELPAWVKQASAGEKERAQVEVKKEEDIEEKVDKEKQEQAKKDQVQKDEVVKKTSIFDNITNFFAPAPKPGSAAPAKPGAKSAPKTKKGEKPMDQKAKQELMEAERMFQEGQASIRDLIAPASMNINFDNIRVEGMYAQSFYVYAYPRYLDANWLSPVINFDVTMDMAQFIYPIDSEAIMRVLKRKVAQMQSGIRISEEKGNVRDPAIETALQDAEELRTQIQRGQEKFYQLAIYFTIYAEDNKKLQRISKQLQSLLGGKLVLTKKAEFQAEHAFNSTLPICTDELEVTLNMNTSPLSTMFPFNSAELTSNKGILYGLNRHNDSLIIFDRFDLENANSVVFAKSGAGKSYAVKLEVLRSLMFGADVIIIDPEREYLPLCEVVGGSYLKVSLNSDKRINPFDLPAPLKDEAVQPGDLLRANIISLHGLLKIMLGGVSPEEEGMLDKALTDVYALRGITMELEDPSSIPAPTMEDLYDILNSMEGARDLATRLAKFTSGTYAGIFNKPTNVDLTSGLVVFSIRDLEDALRPIAMYIILNFIWNRVRSSLKRRLLVIDEAWSLMQHDDSANFLYGLVKRARKYYLGVTTITQDVEDFLSNKFGKPIITNSSLQILLKQAPAALEMLQKVFNLTEGEKYMLLNSGIGQGLFFAGNKHVAIQIIASYGEDKLVTTNPEEILRTQEESAEYEGEETEENKATEEGSSTEENAESETEDQAEEKTAAELSPAAEQPSPEEMATPEETVQATPEKIPEETPPAEENEEPKPEAIVPEDLNNPPQA